MPKRIITILLCLSIVSVFVGCGKIQSTVVDTVDETSATSLPKADVDIDLTGFSGNMAYSEVYSMCDYPEAYDGKTIRLRGLFSAIYENVEENDLRFTCQVSDATACCSIGIEFVPKQSLTFPDDFPLESTPVIVTGTLKQTNEDFPVYISDAEIEF